MSTRTRRSTAAGSTISNVIPIKFINRSNFADSLLIIKIFVPRVRIIILADNLTGEAGQIPQNLRRLRVQGQWENSRRR